MIDYVKILIQDVDTERLSKLHFLEFKATYNTKTYEISNKEVAEYHHCKIIMYDRKTVLFTGSIHKLYNSLKDIKPPKMINNENYNGFNGNIFTLNQILDIRNHLTQLFQTKPENMIFQNIEIGINTTLNFNPNIFTKGLILHKGKKFEERYNSNYFQVPHQCYILKIYNKGYQYNLPNYTLRIELKFKKMKKVNSIGIFSFKDINKKSLENTKKLLLKELSNVLHYDFSINTKSLSKRLKTTLANYSNPTYWLFTLKTNRRDYHKKQLNKLTNEHSQNLRKEIEKEIETKTNFILKN